VRYFSWYVFWLCLCTVCWNDHWGESDLTMNMQNTRTKQILTMSGILCSRFVNIHCWIGSFPVDGNIFIYWGIGNLFMTISTKTRLKTITSHQSNRHTVLLSYLSSHIICKRTSETRFKTARYSYTCIFYGDLFYPRACFPHSRTQPVQGGVLFTSTRFKAHP